MRWLATLGAVLLLVLAPWPARAQEQTSQTSGASVAVDAAGQYAVRFAGLGWVFGGEAGSVLGEADGSDALGAFHQVTFQTPARTDAIRAYRDQPVALFSSSGGGPNTEAFPRLTTLPRLPYSLSYAETPFSPYQFNAASNSADSPWVYFDAGGNTFLISAASDFPVARLSIDATGGISSGIDSAINDLPSGFTHQTILVATRGINRAFDAWGNALTTLHAKTRPTNDADLTLRTFGYWTDNGAVYYYHYEPQLGYAGTLLAVKHELDQRQIPVGYLQLDSWWYPKGQDMRWDNRDGGIYRYRAASDLFAQGLSAFQQQLGLPLVTHARWIDPSSPYRKEFSFSGNVMTDRAYWDDLMGYLQSGNVVTYEQDWLGAQAQPVYDLTAPRQFMGNMAAAAAQRNITLQYCMPLPRQVLQTLEFNNVTSMRVSDDRFDRNRWDTFLYTSRFASALGVWPWSDVFMSAETNNLVLSVLSAGVVGTGDALGEFNVDNLRRVMRSDAVLIKPDVPLVPTDDAILAEAAQGATAPMVASTYTDHGDSRTSYVFAYARNSGVQSVALPVSQQQTYVWDAFAQRGRTVAAGETYSADVSSGSYFVVAPIGPSGIGLVGDAGAFVSAGQKRISALSDDGAVHATIQFAAGETSVTLFGYAAGPPVVTAANGTADPVTYDSTTQVFRVAIHPASAPATVDVTIAPGGAA